MMESDLTLPLQNEQQVEELVARVDSDYLRSDEGSTIVSLDTAQLRFDEKKEILDYYVFEIEDSSLAQISALMPSTLGMAPNEAQRYVSQVIGQNDDGGGIVVEEDGWFVQILFETGLRDAGGGQRIRFQRGLTHNLVVNGIISVRDVHVCFTTEDTIVHLERALAGEEIELANICIVFEYEIL